MSSLQQINDDLQKLQQKMSEQINNLKNRFFPAANNGSPYNQSNGIIAKFSFVLLILIIFIILFQIISNIIYLFYSPNTSPYLVNGMIDGKESIEISQNPEKIQTYVMRSKNEKSGIEFTWSSWIYIESMDYKEGELKHIYHKGEKQISFEDSQEINDDEENTEDNSLEKTYDIIPGLNYPHNSPGVYLAPNSNTLYIYFNTYNALLEKIEIPNIPMQKWFSLIIRGKDKILDIYINGVVAKRHLLSGIPKQNYGKVYTGLNGGFDGFLSNLRYFNHAVTTKEIDEILKNGISRRLLSEKPSRNDNTNYLSSSWYSVGEIGVI